MSTCQPPRGSRPPQFCLAFALVLLAAAGASPAMAQSPLRTLPGLTDIAVYEATSTVTRNAFGPNSPELATRRSVLDNGSRDVVSFQTLGSASGFELSATSTIVRPGLQTTLSWTDRGLTAGPQYGIFAGPAGAASLSLVATQQCCVLTVPHASVAPGSYDVYVQDSNGVRSNRVTIRFDP